MMPRTGPGSSNAGFTYLGLIILVAILGLVGGASLKLGSLLQRAAAEQELLDIGAAFSDALQSYAAITPKGQPPQPLTLQELLKDPRFPGPRRHLRKIFVDPVSGKAEWGIIYLSDKAGVIGVYSLSQARPLKIANFDARFLDFENKEHLSEWRFTVSGQGAPVAPVQPLLAPPAASEPPGPQPAAPAPPADQPPPEEKPER
jgi:LPXTG-motif cell wall-anchored protein